MAIGDRSSYVNPILGYLNPDPLIRVICYLYEGLQHLSAAAAATKAAAKAEAKAKAEAEGRAAVKDKNKNKDEDSEEFAKAGSGYWLCLEEGRQELYDSVRDAWSEVTGYRQELFGWSMGMVAYKWEAYRKLSTPLKIACCDKYHVNMFDRPVREDAEQRLSTEEAEVEEEEVEEGEEINEHNRLLKQLRRTARAGISASSVGGEEAEELEEEEYPEEDCQW